MSRYHPNPNAKFVYEAAKHWRDTCLLQDGSVFTDKKLWSRENLNGEFVKEFIECVFQLEIPDAATFMDKLVTQLKHVNAHPQIYQLMAEFFWIMHLATSNGAMKETTKRKRIKRLWEESGENLPDHKYFQDEYLGGIAHPGMAYVSQIWRELITLILFVCYIKNLNDNDRKQLLVDGDGKEIALEWESWTTQWNNACTELGSLHAEYRQIRHILLHILFPDHFERAFSGRPKRQIVRALRDKEAAKKTKPEIDEILREIRAEKEKEYGTTELDFFAPPMHRDWQPKHPPEDEDEETSVSTMHLNRIFYGPPGTGKTYRTINAALQILDPGFYEENIGDRELLRERYEELKKEGRIAFVTFHQSFGYEEFVEGICPCMGEDEGEHVSYEIKAGVFKEICGRATSTMPLSLFEEVIEKLKEECEESPVMMKTAVQKRPHRVSYEEGKSFFVVERLKGPNPEAKSHMHINALRRAYEHPGQKRGVLARTFLGYLTKNYGLDDSQTTGFRENYVLIIDEVNRGNISRIFGELITLIEESKRWGNDEQTETILPYSNKPFSVPNNLYIIGTMNTADRSIALLDTALRRRFRFEEMMPKHELLHGIDVDGVNIEALLKTMNERIEALYDRDHQVGHSYFMRLKDSDEFEILKDIFRYEILPLLQEYFYDDWEKIDAVLNSNGFLRPTSPAKIKRGDLIDDGKKLWSVDDDALNEITNYLSIYEGDGGDE